MSTKMPIKNMNIITTLKILYYISIFIWLFPPIRQWKTKYFYFFLILAVADPLSIALKLLIKKNILLYFPFVSLILLLSIIDYKTYIKKKYQLLISLILILLAFIFMQSKLLVVVFQFLIAFVFIKEFVIRFVFDRVVSIFYIILIFYEFTIVFKYFNIFLGFADATAFFIITSIFQIAFGLFFSIFREDKTSIALKRG